MPLAGPLEPSGSTGSRHRVHAARASHLEQQQRAERRLTRDEGGGERLRAAVRAPKARSDFSAAETMRVAEIATSGARASNLVRAGR